MKKKRNVLLTIFGSIFVVLGSIGILVPVLPTTPFLLLAAACFLKSSDKLYEKLINHRVFGKYIRDFKSGKGVPLSSKIIAISLIWLTIGSSALFFVDKLILKIILILIATGVTIYLLTLKTAKKE